MLGCLSFGENPWRQVTNLTSMVSHHSPHDKKLLLGGSEEAGEASCYGSEVASSIGDVGLNLGKGGG